MADIIHFTPHKDLSAQQNLQAFIDLARYHLPTWSNVEGFAWESMRWKTGHTSIRFLSEESANLPPKLDLKPEHLMHPRFIEVAKAYLRHRHHTAPHRNVGREIAALRALEYVLREDMGVPDITKVTQRHFDKAIVLLGRLKAVPFLATELLTILRKLADNQIVTSSAYYWTHPYVGNLSYASTRGAYAPQSVKDKKVPNQDALLAIGAVFSRGYSGPLDDEDVMVTSITAILLSAPMRVGELIRFRKDCLGNDTDKDGKVQYYLKYWVPKTKEFARKPIPEVMAETTIEAIKRLTEITEEGRRLARYMETQPTKFYRHANCPNVPDDQALTRAEVMQALGFTEADSAKAFLKKWTGNRSLTNWTLDSLWQVILKAHREANPNFPYQERVDQNNIRPPKMSDSLLCSRRFQYAKGFSTSPVLLAPFMRDHYSIRLRAKVDKRPSKHKNPLAMCFFVKHGFESIRLKSHSIRHMLNRLAQQNGITLDVITAWSNRSSFHQTLTYLDNDQGKTAATAAALMDIGREQSPKDPVTNQEAEIYGQGPIHRSRYGLCRRSWRVGPCNKFGDCLNCSELLMCKGDKVAAQIIAEDRENLVKTYNAAQQAVERGERSATRWLKVARPQIERLNQLLAVLNDPSIEEGSPIEISDSSDFSHEQTLVNEKAVNAGVNLLDRRKLGIEYGAELLACLDELKGSRNA